MNVERLDARRKTRIRGINQTPHIFGQQARIAARSPAMRPMPITAAPPAITRMPCSPTTTVLPAIHRPNLRSYGPTAE